MIKLFVSGFPLEITELELAKLIALHGDIVTIKIVRDKKTRICKGYAFIEMASQADAENAVIALDGLEMHDRKLTVKISEEKAIAPKSNFRRPVVGENAKRPRRPRV